MILIKENQKIKEEKTELSLTNTNYKEKMEQFEEHLNSLRDEIANSQKTYKSIIAEKEG